MDYNERNFMIFPTDQLYKIDFSQVLETSAETVRKSVDGTKTFVKWDDGNNTPECISTLTNTEGPYTYQEMLAILSTEEWTSSVQEM